MISAAGGGGTPTLKYLNFMQWKELIWWTICIYVNNTSLRGINECKTYDMSGASTTKKQYHIRAKPTYVKPVELLFIQHINPHALSYS